MDVDKIAFTGSTITGRRIAIAAAESNLKSVTLELGGKSANVIFDDANLQEAAKWAAFGVYENMGASWVSSRPPRSSANSTTKVNHAAPGQGYLCKIQSMISS